jgi:hypothetical protein
VVFFCTFDYFEFKDIGKVEEEEEEEEEETICLLGSFFTIWMHEILYICIFVGL